MTPFDWSATGDQVVHIMPVDDGVVHEDEFCVCGPSFSECVDGRVIVVHDALDGRTVE